MPIKVQNDLPAKKIMEKENIFIMNETRAVTQNIRPLQIAILNLMPLKEDTEIQMMRSLSNTPLQLEITFLTTASYIGKNTPASHLNQFYQTFDDVKNKNFDSSSDTSAFHIGFVIFVLLTTSDIISLSAKKVNTFFNQIVINL